MIPGVLNRKQCVMRRDAHGHSLTCPRLPDKLYRSCRGNMRDMDIPLKSCFIRYGQNIANRLDFRFRRARVGMRLKVTLHIFFRAHAAFLFRVNRHCAAIPEIGQRPENQLLVFISRHAHVPRALP